MATIEQRIQALETAVNNSRITPQLPQLLSIEGDEFINIWSPAQGRLVKYPYADVINSGVIDPTNDIVPIFKQVPNINFNLDVPTQIANYINSETAFTKTGSQVIFYFGTRKILNPDADSGFDFQREFYLFAKSKGNYGSGSGVTVLPQELVRQTPNIDASGSIQEININATSPYDIETVVNNTTAFTPIPSATILINVLVNGTSNDYYLYQGQTTQDMGTGGYVSVSGDYIDLQTTSADPFPIVVTSAWCESFLSPIQSIEADTWTAVDFTGGVTRRNGGLDLLDVDGTITPINANDVLQCDLGFEFSIPAPNDYFLIRLNVNGVIYGQTTAPMLRTTGIEETIRISFNIPVQQDFVTNGGFWEVLCNKNIDIKNKYTAVTRTHKAI